MNTANFYLKIQQVHQACLFELSWGKGQQLAVTVDYPASLNVLYQEWQQIYLSFYKTALRGRVIDSGSLKPPPIDWHARLVQAEAKLLSEFHRWLRGGELFEIRAAIAKASAGKMKDENMRNNPSSTHINVFLTCSPIELERFPWEAWEIATELTNAGSIRIFRKPLNIRAETSSRKWFGRRRARVLAILGDETGLDFHADRQAVASLGRAAEVEFVGWQPGEGITELKQKICAAIADDKGWDILFFAGHSNENAIAGGQLAIAPGVSILISEIAAQLTKAKDNGLQFAIFNSCSGLSIANSLIDLGLSQVAVMREPIHNKVAQEFLVRFLQSLVEQKDVHESMLAACQYLKLEKNLTYPSSYLIPSLYCHPNAVPFRLETFGLKQVLKQWLPTQQELLPLAILLILSLLHPLQNFLLEWRLLLQAFYIQNTGQIAQNTKPPILLAQIDEPSIRKAKISNPIPMDRKYLAKLVQRLSDLNARVVGIDYLLDRPQENNDRYLAESLKAAVKKQPYSTWFVFVETQDYATGQMLSVLPEIASNYWSLRGSMDFAPGYVQAASIQSDRVQSLPFSYLLALAYKQQFKQSSNLLQPQLKSREDFLSQIGSKIQEQGKKHYKNLFSSRSYFHPITDFSYNFNQVWLQPIVDFSIPPTQVYNSIPAWQLLSGKNIPQLNYIQQQVVMIIPGGYDEAGVGKPGEDNLPVPAAIRYWRKQKSSSSNNLVFTGGETHAYMVHHFLTKRLVIPIPDLWTIAIAGLLGKGTTMALWHQLRRQHGNDSHLRRQRGRWAILLICTTAGYGLVSLQVYIYGAILLPFVLPSVTFWSYVLPTLIGRRYYA